MIFGLNPLWGFLPLLLYIVLMLRGKDMNVSVLLCVILGAILTGESITGFANVIYESLGSFCAMIQGGSKMFWMLQNENIPYGPEDMYQMYNLTSDSTMRDLFAKRSHGFKQGLQSDHRAFETIIPMLEYENGKLVRLQLLPVDLGFGQHRSVSGLPRPCPGAPFMERLVEMSKAYQTQIVPCENGLYEVVLSD